MRISSPPPSDDRKEPNEYNISAAENQGNESSFTAKQSSPSLASSPVCSPKPVSLLLFWTYLKLFALRRSDRTFRFPGVGVGMGFIGRRHGSQFLEDPCESWEAQTELTRAHFSQQEVWEPLISAINAAASKRRDACCSHPKNESLRRILRRIQ